MEFSILGPIEVWSGKRVVPLSGARRRALLGLLVVSANRAVKADTLIEHVWGSSAPDAAAATLQSHVSQLRKILDPGRLSSRPGGYLLHVDDGELDAAAFEGEVAAGRSALRSGDAAGAAELFDQALARWRGPALTDAGDGMTVRAEAARLEELRLIAMESQMEARLALGQFADVARVAEVAIAEHPLRERLWAQLMVALYRGGRQAEALQAYQRLRHHLGEELGIDPSPELRSLEESILRHDQTLAGRPAQAPAAAPAPARQGAPSELAKPPESRALAALPSGVVTFLLTDVVGSSRLWDRDPDTMAVALARHDEIIASAVAGHRGVLLKARGEGDSAFAVFQRVTDAVAAAVAAQRAVGAETWPPVTPMSVRMAIHTGEAFERDGDYYGPTVNRVARLRALAGGGQVLLSQATATVVRDGLPDGIELVDLGQQELRDLTRSEMVYGLSGHGLGPVVPLTGGAGTVVPGEVVIPLPPRLADLPETGFVGRTFERDLVVQRAKDVHEGGRRVVLVSGEPGIGKTRLSAQAARAALEAGLIVLYGRADEDLGLPYQPFVESLDHLVRHAPSALLEAHVVRHGGDLARLVPSLRHRLPHLPPPQTSDPETERYLLFGAVVGLLGAASAMAPVVLVLDDLHWADRPTVQLLRYVIAAPEPLRTLIVASYRDSDLTASHPMTDLLATLRREQRVERLSLKGLEDAELVDLMEHLSGRVLDTSAVAFAHGLRRETDGNPFFVTEILRDLTESGALRTEEGGWVLGDQPSSIRLPDSVREVVGQRVARLGDTAVKVLTAAAVIGHDFDFGVLAAAVDVDDELVVDSLDLAAEANLVTSTGPGRLSFAHALIEHSLYDGLTSARRARLHRRVAVALEEVAGDGSGSDSRVGELAYHWAQATQPTDLDKAVDYAYQAGQRALAHLAPDEAARWFDQAMELLGDTPGSLHCDLMTALGEAKRQTGDAGFRETLLQAAAEAGALGDPARMARAVLANSRGFFAASGVVDVERIGQLEAALVAVGERDSADRARLLARLGSELSYSGDPGRRRVLSDDALAVARRLGDPVTLAHVLRERNEAIAPPDMLDEKLANTAELVALAGRLGDPVVRFWAIYWRSIAALQDAKFDEFEQRLDQFNDLATAIGQPTLRWTVAWVSSVEALLVGDVERAEELALEALQLGNDTGQPDAVAIFGGQLLEIRHHQGRSAELVGLIAQTVVDNPGIPAFQAALARAQCYAGQPAADEARAALLLAAADRFAGMPYDVVWLTGIALWAQVAVRLGEPGAAAVLTEVLSPFKDQIVLVGPVCQGAVVEALGELAAVEGRNAEAVRLLGEAEDLYQSIPAPFYLAQTRLHLGRLLLAGGTPEEADRGVRLLQLANRAARDGGFEALRQETAAALASASG